MPAQATTSDAALPPEPSAAPAAMSMYKVPAVPTTVKLLTTGKGKGKGKATALRYAFTAASAQLVERKIGTSVDLTVIGNGPPHSQQGPTQELAGTFEVVSVDPGSVAMRITTETASATDAQITQPLQELIGTTLDDHLDARGESGELAVTSRAPDASSAKQLAGMIYMRSRPIVLPTEPVVVGATWSVVRDDDVSGIVSTVTTTYTLTARKGKLLTVTGTIQAVARPQTVASTTGSIELKSLSGTGRLTATVDLGHPIPVLDTIEKYDALMTIHGQELRVVSNVTMHQTTRPR